MAASCSERRDVKLESFLNRTLPPEEYERLLARQPTVAVVASSDRGGGRGAAAGKPAHRHAVLGHCKLYLTDVPPKNLRTTLLLKHVESILILDEPAEFLQGREREEAVHVQICFTRDVRPEKNLLSSFGDLRFLNTTASSSRNPTEGLSLPSQPLTITRDSVEMSSCHSLTHLDQLQQKGQFTSPQITAKSRASSKGRLTAQSPLSLHGASSSRPSSRREAQKSLSPLGNSTPVASTLKQYNRKHCLLERSLEPSPPRATTLNLSRDMKQIQLSPGKPTRLSDDSLASSHSSPTLLLGSQAPSFSPTLSLPSSRNSSPHSSSSGDLESPEKGTSTKKQEARKERCMLHLYLLSPNTDFYQHLCTAWLDQKIAVTLASGGHMHPPKSQRPSDHFSHHFHTLRQELLSAKTSRESAQLSRELCSACQRYFIVKQLFWESTELVDHLIQMLHFVPSKASAKEISISTELKCRVDVLELLYQMMRETHGLQRRCLALTGNSGRRLRKLLTATVSLTPTLSEMESMDDEVVEISCSVLSEVMRLAQQMRWPCAPGGVVSLDWTLDILAKHPHIREFCGAVIGHESSLLHQEHLEPCQEVSLYHMTFLLHCLTSHSQPLLVLLCKHFSEEFKYVAP
ncbi:Uncharacterized protein C12orf56 [Geodia barretti]|uniref:Uncharacterized protein C12orf56 n=1 Tax=Geodia barretti TaxID=519541 RepID=A0AA35SK76_GEOBA|nr:Uncharacterized protein C12orf56 [Geodia barretti]